MNFLVIRNDLAIHPGLSHSPGDQLSILTSEIEDEDLFCHGGAKVRKTGRAKDTRHKAQGTRYKEEPRHKVQATRKNQGIRYKVQGATGLSFPKREDL